jgi:hypothetical protein
MSRKLLKAACRTNVAVVFKIAMTPNRACASPFAQCIIASAIHSNISSSVPTNAYVPGATVAAHSNSIIHGSDDDLVLF